jgi:2-polyprenyl-3-methyl-5-hydroxy-6-metoxy-1,4-benzoquinol methylase
MISADIASGPDVQVTAACVVCGSRLTPDPYLTAGKLHLFRCPECHTWSSQPRIDAAAQTAIHDSGEYFEHPYFEGRRLTLRAQQRCRDVFKRLGATIDIASLYGQPLLDIGCDTGVFLDCARKQFGIVPIGIDVAERSVAAAASAGIEAYRTSIEQAPSHLHGFRAITAVDILEHVVDPLGFLIAVRERLAPGGVLFLETPNIRSAIYRIGRTLCKSLRGRPRWMFERLFPPQHIQYFNVHSLERLARKSGLQVAQIGTRVLPWPDISASIIVRGGVLFVQLADLATQDRKLIWAVLRKPAQHQEKTCN